MLKNKQLLLDRITIDSKILAGKPTIRGLRITVNQIIEALAAGLTHEELLEDYPELEKEDIQAALLYAAELLAEEQIYIVYERN